VYVLAATHQVRARTFFLADALSALLSVPLVVSLGYLFAAKLDAVKKRVHEAQLLAAAVVILIVVGYLVVRRLRSVPRSPGDG